MTPLRIAALVGATLITGIAATATFFTASVDQWPGAAGSLRSAAIGAWIIFAVTSSTDRIIAAINALGHDVGEHGENRYSDGVIDGMGRAIPSPQGVRRIR